VIASWVDVLRYLGAGDIFLWMAAAAVPIAVAAVVVHARPGVAPISWSRVGLDVALGLYLVAVVRLTQTGPPAVGQLDLWPFDTIGYLIRGAASERHIAGNLLMLVPFGGLVPIRWRRLDGWGRVLLAAAVFVSVIETLQFLRGRIADADDVVLGAAGALVGYAGMRLGRAARKRYVGLRP
jgi:glycopeptide antibiotics resistance protein